MEKAGFSFFVHTTSGIFPLATKASDTVATLKAKIQGSKKGILPEQYRLHLAGKQLEDHLKLSDYKIQKESTIHLVPRLGGGMLV